jgi:site-specific DNA recombinase
MRAALALKNLDFDAKRAIVMNVVDKVVATRERCEVYGIIPVTDCIGLCTKDRNAANATRYDSSNRFMKAIRFELAFPLPPPLRRGVDYGFVPGTNVSRRGPRRSDA